MGTYTPNLNLYKPDAGDDFGSFRTEFNDNMDKLDNGGGGGGGHTIVDENGSDMPAEGKLQFTGNVSVSDDNVNGATVVDIKGGNVYGAFLDPSRVIYSAFTFDNTEHSWTATEDVILTDDILPPSGSMAWYVRIDGKQVGAGYDLGNLFVYVKKGQVVTYRAKSGSTMKAYGLLQGTNGIFAPVIYSDTERVIGVWRDNKPLYQKTWLIPKSSLNSGETTYTHGDDLHIDNLVRVEGTVGNSRPLVEYHSNSIWACSIYNIGNNAFWIYLGSSVYSNLSASSYVKVTLRYTKTTDVAGSGDYNTDGVPTVHYSTSEQVVGTWIDSKPVYQKTLVGSNALSAHMVFAHGINALGVLIKSDCILRADDNSYQIPASTDQNNIEFEVTPTNIEIWINNDFLNLLGSGGYVITLQYTKTTD